MRHVVYLSIGTNLGDRKKNINICLNHISNKSTILNTSSIYETEPWGYDDDKKYLNVVVKILTNFQPINLLNEFKSIEDLMGRVKKKSKKRYNARIIDIDILFFDSEIINTPNLVIPHPRLYFRNYVLEPFCEIDYSFVCPKKNKSINYFLLQKIDLCRVYVYKD